LASSAQIRRPFDEPLRAMGFRKALPLHAIELAPNIRGLVGLNLGRKGQSSDSGYITPVLGVEYAEAEKLYSRLQGETISPVNMTISTPLASLMPRQLMLSFDWVVSLSDMSTYAPIIEQVREYGLPFLQSHASLESGLDAARAGRGFKLEFRIPVFEYLLGNTDAARRELEKLGESQVGQTGPWPTYVRNFVTSFFLEMEKSE
jgi:hypothetical protein